MSDCRLVPGPGGVCLGLALVTLAQQVLDLGLNGAAGWLAASRLVQFFKVNAGVTIRPEFECQVDQLPLELCVARIKTYGLRVGLVNESAVRGFGHAQVTQPGQVGPRCTVLGTMVQIDDQAGNRVSNLPSASSWRA